MCYEFTVDVNGKTYKCERTVTGKLKLSQQVRVIGVGSKNDPARYPANSPRVKTMESIARIIVREIIDGI